MTILCKTVSLTARATAAVRMTRWHVKAMPDESTKDIFTPSSSDLAQDASLRKSKPIFQINI